MQSHVSVPGIRYTDTCQTPDKPSIRNVIATEYIYALQ
jgi:hypothetical protein